MRTKFWLLGLVAITLAPGFHSLTSQAQQEPTATPAPRQQPSATTSGMMGMATPAGQLSSNDLVPLVQGIYDGEEVLFIHTEVSDPDVADMLTEMMGPQVVHVPNLADVPEELLGNVYVFTNGVPGGGPMGFQPDVFDSVPGDETYTPLRAVSLVTWQEDSAPRQLRSVEEIEMAEEAGEIVIERPGIVVNMPILVWPGGHR